MINLALSCHCQQYLAITWYFLVFSLVALLAYQARTRPLGCLPGPLPGYQITRLPLEKYLLHKAIHSAIRRFATKVRVCVKVDHQANTS